MEGCFLFIATRLLQAKDLTETSENTLYKNIIYPVDIYSIHLQIGDTFLWTVKKEKKKNDWSYINYNIINS